jgi:7-cyano-7-deazaguanine reductase
MEGSPLGKATTYTSDYDPGLLFRIPREGKRLEIGVVTGKEPFDGVDQWNAYEFSCLNEKGKPLIAILHITVPCLSPSIFESKSIKLYLNSFNQLRLPSLDEAKKLIEKDLSEVTGAEVKVSILSPEQFPVLPLKEFDGTCVDGLDVAIENYTVDPSFLTVHSKIVEESLYSHLLKSNCLVTNQPDWGTVWIHYKGRQIDPAGLLKYIVSFRLHNEFHEQCIERIFVNIMERCQPEKLTVYGKYTRRGGIDINPFRSNFESKPVFTRTSRQ